SAFALARARSRRCVVLRGSVYKQVREVGGSEARAARAIVQRTRRATWFTSGRGSGGGSMAGLPTGTVTFVFTDLVVSTRLWEVEPDGMSAALARHDEILRAAIAAHGGRVVKGRGDGVHAVFVTAADAVRASIEFQRSLGAESWPVSEPLQ